MAAFDSSDEGEIIESGAEDLKATSLPQPDGSNVDRRDRPRGRYSRSPDRDDASSRRSRSPRGHKRPRRDPSDRDYYGHKRHNSSRDTRRFQVRYEDSLHYDEDDVRQSRDRDLHPNGPRRGTPDFDSRSRDWDHRRDRGRDRPRNRDRSRDRHLDRRLRNRSRSPKVFSRGDSRRDGRERRGLGFGDREERAHTPKYGDHGDRSPRDLHRSKMAIEITKEVDAKAVKESVQANGLPDSQSRQDAPESMLVDEPVPEVEEAPVDIEAEIERRRRRRDELLAKSRADTPTLVVQALHLGETAPSTPLGTHGNTPNKTTGNTPFSGVPSPRESTPGVQEELTPPALDISNDQELINTHGQAMGNEEDGPSAADYDPTVDMKEDGIREELRHGHYNDTVQEPEPVEEKPAPPQKDEADDDDFDMFAEDFDEDKYAAPKAAEIDQVARAVLPDQANAGGILEGADKDGYYKIRIGEILNGRYQIETTLGKGMFSGVARARDITNNQQVAIKMMRNNDALRKGGFTEIAILQKINSADPDNKKHIVKFERYFDHKQHLCMVFENLSLNLREVLRKFGNNVGINLVAVRAYARQIFIALAHLKHCSIIHADLKPDNILVNETRNVLKICDLGTAVDRSDAATAHDEVSPYLVSRFYRAPEIILGMPYDFAVDMWSIGCTLYELYTGKILFTGESNNQMLKAIMEIRGKLSSKLYRRGQLSHHHFDEKGNFISVERDKLIIGKSTVKILPVVKPTRDLRTRLVAASTGMGDDETKLLNHFVDLLERCLALNPDRRITPSEALKHPFFNHHPSRVHPSAGRKV